MCLACIILGNAMAAVRLLSALALALPLLLQASPAVRRFMHPMLRADFTMLESYEVSDRLHGVATDTTCRGTSSKHS